MLSLFMTYPDNTTTLSFGITWWGIYPLKDFTAAWLLYDLQTMSRSPRFPHKSWKYCEANEIFWGNRSIGLYPKLTVPYQGQYDTNYIEVSYWASERYFLAARRLKATVSDADSRGLNMRWNGLGHFAHRLIRGLGTWAREFEIDLITLWWRWKQVP